MQSLDSTDGLVSGSNDSASKGALSQHVALTAKDIMRAESWVLMSKYCHQLGTALLGLVSIDIKCQLLKGNDVVVCEGSCVHCCNGCDVTELLVS